MSRSGCAGGLVSAVIPYGLGVQVNQPKELMSQIEPKSWNLCLVVCCVPGGVAAALARGRFFPIKAGDRITRLSWC